MVNSWKIAVYHVKLWLMWKMLRPSHNYQPVSIPQQNTIKNSLALFVQDRINASLFAPAEANYQRKN